MGGHPSAPIVPALWALAERRGLGGRALLSAYIAGVEVETRLGRAVNFHHYEKGWHPTATLGVFGAAAAASHLMGLDRVKTAAALALAASMASGLKANFGTMTKPFHVGFCARNGLSAAMLARAGVTSNPAALEHPQGFFKVYDEGQVNADAVLAHWADPLDLIEPGIAFKRHPCCASTHPAIDALLILRERHHLRPENVRAIRSWTHPRRLRHTNRPNPTTGLDAKFSVQYVLSRALIQGRLTLGDFDDTAVADKSVRAVMARVLAEPHPKADMESYEHFFAEVTVTTTDGQELHARVERPLGRDRAHPLPDGALEAKFMDCAVPVVGESSAQALREHLCTLETVASITAISPFLVGTEV
jgi:2-methylcitrate dehydratase PrpD